MDQYSCLDDHTKTIVHIDIDCFYAQVEMVKKPELKNLPLGIQQKNIVVTCNYLAREYGVKKCMLITEAKKLCPNLVLVNGEDLHDYRQISFKITALLQKYSNLVERLGLDENFVDVTDLVKQRLKNSGKVNIIGNIFGTTSDSCDCGCYERLKIGTCIAQDIRDQIKSELQLSTCAGIGHNKLLAKLAGCKYKPNQQTVVFPNSAVELMLSLPSLSNIPGIGSNLNEQLNNIGIIQVQDLQSADLSKLINLLGPEKAKIIYDLSFGLDRTAVKASGKPQSIGIEDSCKTISAEKEVREKLEQLLKRLLILVSEDGRIPKNIKLTIRKYNRNNALSSRESRQCNINTTIFGSGDLTNLSEGNLDKIMTVIMRLFKKLIDTNKPYHLTLLGLSFTKFVERLSAKNTLIKFLVNDIEVQSITNIKNLTETVVTPKQSPSTSYTENLEVDLESTAKKFKCGELVAKKRFFKDIDDCASPSKLRVAELRLNSTENPIDTNQNIMCPPNADQAVFRELPKDIQQELWEEYKQKRGMDSLCSSQQKKTKPNSILKYLVKH